MERILLYELACGCVFREVNEDMLWEENSDANSYAFCPQHGDTYIAGLSLQDPEVTPHA